MKMEIGTDPSSHGQNGYVGTVSYTMLPWTISSVHSAGMVSINNYNANRESFGVSRMELYSKKEQGIVYRNQMLRENTPFQ